jgi:diguanylate cyclase
MPVTHEPWLVALSLLIAIQGAYVGLSLAVRVGAAAGLRRRLLLAAAAISLAVAVWAMHFVGMLAARLPFPVDYLVFPTLLSFLACVIVVGAAVFAVSAGPLRAGRLAASAAFMGGGIASMHYIGMTALHASAHMEHAPVFVVASVIVGMAASGLALWLAGGRDGRPPLLLSATALGIAIAGMHYTAMAGLTVFPDADPLLRAPALSTDLLAIVVAIVAFLVSGIFLLTLVPDRPGEQGAAPAAASPGENSPGDIAEPGQRADPPLGGGPTPRLAPNLPVQRHGATHFIAVDQIVAVHADAHYTQIFDGVSKLFCPLAIGDVAARLDANRFVRVHRSHIVNIDRIVRLRRDGDHGIVELAGDGNYTVPVARNRFTALKSLLEAKAGEPVSSAS